MTPTRLLDTCVFIHHLQGKSPAATEFIKQAISGEYPAAFSVYTDAELWSGVRDDRDDRDRRILLSRMERLPFTLAVARRAGKLHYKHRLEKLALSDAIIAATAEIYNLPLCTNNIKHFAFIQSISLIPYTLTA